MMVANKFVNGKYVLYVPESMRRDLIREIHSNGHFASRKIENIINSDYYIPKLADRVKEVVKC